MQAECKPSCTNYFYPPNKIDGTNISCAHLTFPPCFMISLQPQDPNISHTHTHTHLRVCLEPHEAQLYFQGDFMLEIGDATATDAFLSACQSFLDRKKNTRCDSPDSPYCTRCTRVHEYQATRPTHSPTHSPTHPLALLQSVHTCARIPANQSTIPK